MKYKNGPLKGAVAALKDGKPFETVLGSVALDKKGDINLMALIPADKKQKDKQKTEKVVKPEKKAEGKSSAPPPLPLQVDELRIDAGKITFKDEKPTDPVSLAVNQLNLKVNDFSMKKDAKSHLELATEFGKKGKISAVGPFTARLKAITDPKAEIGSTSRARW